ncbi:MULTISPECIES: epoxide hydrolase N-terminal domain-containing protein [unclassified Micromonospora]|uniref:epoxide hydrolase N-terminal domain-containing protein n=1 Tax=unclassified Micromonospora TaxID=2617518 RepID=UPI001C21B15A|nr:MULTISPECIES: epoxide hydrolase N-terminal domain-containing protein [unclassified Micromonospora]MBU8857160.1 epoxide hydrolase N-terminal domain-containing protein [Micromonospora sp. WMMB482]MDM4782781.1 epoxide hydrolase N-terminal domain-containing protein [Micromonospora sp. b486]
MATDDIRPFRLDTPDETIADLHRRIAATRWPSRPCPATASPARRPNPAGRTAASPPPGPS